ncbi:class F sortase [Bacillus sp. FJAT-45037]|uniref:class F sortase n=1 Tax=Bacillus sp. FJAT-45037 TaxID=2011007 RepID=UPI000C2443EE|nr:class F sortase [Bacillus sp. FJAT-45037]
MLKQRAMLIVGFGCMMLALYQLYWWSNTSNATTSIEPQNQIQAQEIDEMVIEEPLDRVLDGEFTVLDFDQFEQEKAEVEIQGIQPSRIQIPSIEVDARTEEVGVLDNGEMGVPEEIDQVGWFEPGTKPGNVGNAVMAGHVDSRTGPAIFFRLDELEEGDEVIVSSDSDETYTFVVTGKESYPYDSAPIAEIFGRSDTRNLNLITCTGTFNRSVGTHEERLVVFTELKEDETIPEPPPAPSNVALNGLLLSWHAVRDQAVVGYRVYQSENGETFDHVASISAHERKSYLLEMDQFTELYVTSVDRDGSESERSELIKNR